MRRVVPLPQGLMETSQSGSIPLGSYDQGLNVRDYDERSDRARPASRAGLLPVGRTTPCPNATPVTMALTAKEALSRFEFVELNSTPQTDVTPAQVAEKWNRTLDAAPIAAALAPDGITYALLSTGAVVSIEPNGSVQEAFAAPVPEAFSLVPSIAVDDLGGVYVAASFNRQIDGGASRVYRWRRDEDGAWELQYTETIEDSIERLWESDTELFATLRRPDNQSEVPDGVPEGPEYMLGRFGGAPQGAYSTLWKRAAPDAVVDLAFRAGSVYAAAPPNSGREGGVGVGTPSVSWTPRELANADRRLFSWQSALHLQNVVALESGSAVETWTSARFEPSDFADVIDTTARDLTRPASDSFQFYSPRFEQSPDGSGPEVRFDVLPSATPSAGAQFLFSNTHSSNREKSSSLDSAPYQRALIPQMQDASSDGHHFAFTLLIRIENWEDPAASVTFTTPKVIFQMGDVVLSYVGDVGNTTITLSLETPGVNQPPTGAGDTINVGADGFAYAVITIRCDGFGTGGSFWRVNGEQVGGATFQWDTPTGIQSRFNLGRVNPTSGKPQVRFIGGIKEMIGVLGSDTLGVHNTQVDLAEIEELEGFVCHAYGLQSILPASHSYDVSPPAGAGDSQGNFELEAAFQVPEGLLAKLDRSSGDLRWIYKSPAAGNGVAVSGTDDVFSIGTPLDLSGATPARLAKLTDAGETFTEDWTIDDVGTGEDTVWRDPLVDITADPCGRVYVPWVSIGTVPASELRKYDTDGTPLWTLAIPQEPRFVLRGGLFVDDRLILGACGDEFLYVLSREDYAQRIDTLGRRDTGETRNQGTEVIAACESGVVSRLPENGEWTQIVSDFTPGGRPWSFELFGRHFFGGPEDYRVWDPRVRQLRNWTPGEGSIIPARIYAAIRWRGRVLCVSQDDPHILFGSEYGNAFQFNSGGEVVTATQAFAGTAAATGAIPDPIIALEAGDDDLAFVFTTRSVWRLTGDPQTGGQLDGVLPSKGIADTFACARGENGEIYWMTSDREIAQLGSQGVVDISSTSIRGRLQRVDTETTRVELHYSNREKGLYVLFFPRGDVPELGIEHLFWSRRTQRWHPVQFAGGIGRALTVGGVLENADAAGWGAMFGFADGGLRFAHPEAFDDDGVPIPSRMRIPLTGDGDPQRALVTYAEVVLDPTQGPVRAVGVAGRTGETGDDYGAETLVVPGRGDFVNLQISGSHTWLELIGTGQPWAVDSIAVDAHVWGAA